MKRGIILAVVAIVLGGALTWLHYYHQRSAAFERGYKAAADGGAP